MTTTQRIQSEINTLPNEAQDKVLAYIEWLKYKALVAEVEQLSSILGGLQDPTDEIDPQQLAGKGATSEIVREKLQIVKRAMEALNRIRTGQSGIPHEALKQQARQWRSK